MKTYIAVGGFIVVVLAVFLFLILGKPTTPDPTPVPTPPPVDLPTPDPAPVPETRNCADLYDRNDVVICEGDRMTDSTIPNQINVIHYGIYKGVEQFYVVGPDGTSGDLIDLKDAPKEQRDLIIK